MYKLINDNLKKKKNKHFLIHDRLENLLYINRAMQVVKFRMHVPTHHPIIKKKKNIYIYMITTCRNFCIGPKSTAQIFIYPLALLLPPSHY
jgi:hypothetical protein